MTEFRGWGGAALVTGATSGIGLEIARALAARQMDLILVARSAGNLRVVSQQLASAHRVRVVPVAYDLSTPDVGSTLGEVFREIDLEIDLLVNNAAFAVYGPFANQGPEREAEMIRLNTIAPTLLTAMFLPGMVRRRRGVVLNVASTAGFAPVPFLGSYAASKAHLISWTHALDTELKGTGVRCSVLCPGSTSTNFQRVSGAAERQRRRFKQQTALEVAEQAMVGLDKGRRVITTSRKHRLHQILSRVVPPGLAASLAMSAMKPKGKAIPG
ncbi:MAG: short-chain dehydrogenase [Gemmatimonadota bacterium]|nr:MAG: short-chain dehydrogenase [Gemmatimonadota bacterium]